MAKYTNDDTDKYGVSPVQELPSPPPEIMNPKWEMPKKTSSKTLVAPDAIASGTSVLTRRPTQDPIMPTNRIPNIHDNAVPLPLGSLNAKSAAPSGMLGIKDAEAGTATPASGIQPAVNAPNIDSAAPEIAPAKQAPIAAPDIYTNDYLDSRFGSAAPPMSDAENEKLWRERIAGNESAQLDALSRPRFDDYSGGRIQQYDRAMQGYAEKKRADDIAKLKLYQDQYQVDVSAALKKIDQGMLAPKIAAETEKLTQEATAVPKLAEADAGYKKSLADSKSLSAKSYRGQWFVDQGKILTNKLYDPLTPEEEKPAIRTALTQLESDLAELEDNRQSPGGPMVNGKLNDSDPRVKKARAAGYSDQQISEYLSRG